MAIDSATFAVQRGDQQFSCLGSELDAKLLDDDLLLAQRGDTHGHIVKGDIQDTDLFVVTDGDNGHKSVTGAQVKTLFGPPPMPWEGHDGGIFHIKNGGETITLYTYANPSYTAWDVDGTNERQITEVSPGEELVLVTPHDPYGLFEYNDTATWEFGEFTDTSKVTTMYRMFKHADSFNGDISNWDTSNVDTMSYLFNYAYAFNQDISAWDTSKVEHMVGMFNGATAFNQDLSEWCVPNVDAKQKNFDKGAGFEGNSAKQPQWGTCPRGEDSKP